ncbi:9565_t:CDS:2, partial [Entrophospora sp. SA101]
TLKSDIKSSTSNNTLNEKERSAEEVLSITSSYNLQDSVPLHENVNLYNHDNSSIEVKHFIKKMKDVNDREVESMLRKQQRNQTKGEIPRILLGSNHDEILKICINAVEIEIGYVEVVGNAVIVDLKKNMRIEGKLFKVLTPPSTSTDSSRPGSFVMPVEPPTILDQSHLRPGHKASLLSHTQTLELYRQNAKKTNDPELQFEFAAFMIEASRAMNEDPKKREELCKEGMSILKKLSDRGHANSQYYLADCYASAIGTSKNKPDLDKAFPLFVQASKHGHPEAAYRAGVCYEYGWGCRKDSGKALQFLRKSATASHPGAMYRLGIAELKGELGLSKNPRDGVKWLKRSVESANEEFPHALHELSELHEKGVENIVFVDLEYSVRLLIQAADLGYAPSAFKLGECYEYGKMGCPQDAALSIHYYTVAAQQDHPEACFALTAWYLVGSPGVLPQSDTEAYLWAKRAAEKELAKAEYAIGYFTEVGIGIQKDQLESNVWYRRAAEHGDKRAQQRLRGVPIDD